MMASRPGDTSWFSLETEAGEACRIASVKAAPDPANARRPVAISYSNAPADQMSVRASSFLFVNCSGDMYGYVPATAWV